MDKIKLISILGYMFASLIILFFVLLTQYANIFNSILESIADILQ